MEPRPPTEKMTEPTTPDSTTVPDPAVVVDPTAVNGRCEQADSIQQQPNTENHAEGFKMDQEMKINDSIDDRGRRLEFCLKFLWMPRGQDTHRA